MADLQLSVLTTEFVKVPVQAVKSGSPYDPTGDAVKMAFKAVGSDPTSGDWKTASWETEGASTSRPIHFARCLVGPTGDANPGVGLWVVWVQITDSPEVPVVACGTLQIV